MTVPSLFFDPVIWSAMGSLASCLLALWCLFTVLVQRRTLRRYAEQLRSEEEERVRLMGLLEIETRRGNEYLGVIRTAQGERDTWKSWYMEASTQYGAAQQLFMAEREVNIGRMRQAGVTPYHDRLLNLAIDAIRERDVATEPCEPPSRESHPEPPPATDAA